MTYRALSIPAAPPAWQWTRPRIADALGLWRWPWGRRWGGGRWAVRAVAVQDVMTPAEMRAAVRDYYGDPGPSGFALLTWADAETARWRPTAACPRGCCTPPLFGDVTGLWCDCEDW